MKTNLQLTVISIVFLCFCSIILLSNYLMNLSIETQNDNFEMISGILFGFVGIPVFSIILPLYFANKWGLNFSLWPKTKTPWKVVILIIGFAVLVNFAPLKSIVVQQITFQDYFIHFISTMLFHVTYYPLFAIFMFPVFRKKFGLWPGIIITSALFALYHLTQYHFFPAGTTLPLQIMLFIAFAFNLLIYLWTESIILVSLMHSATGAIGLLSNGMISKEPDFLFFFTFILVFALFSYFIIKEQKQRRKKEYNEDWWFHLKKIQ